MKKYCLLLVTSILLVPLIYTHEKNCDDRVKFVQGGLCKPGNGSKKHPFMTLAQAEADQAYWDVLIVLSSSSELNGGITLLPGRKLIGEEDPTGINLSITQPTITNTTNANGGHGVVVTGDATIENLHINNTLNDGLNYDQAVDLTVNNLLITGFGGSGIRGDCTKSGKTDISHVVIRNNKVTKEIDTIAIADSLSKGIERRCTIANCEISDLASDQSAGKRVFGIRCLSGDENTSSVVEIKDTYIHDFIAPNNSNIAAVLEAFDGSSLAARVSDSTFYNIGFNSGHVVGFSFSTRPSLKKEDLKICVNRSVFEELVENNQTIMASLQTASGSSDLTVKNSYSTNLAIPVFSSIRDKSEQKIKIIGNLASGGSFGTFFLVQSSSSVMVSGITDALVKDNSYTGGSNSSAIQVFAGSPWDRLNLKLENNCFSSLGGDVSLGLSGFSTRAAISDAGNATITATHNSFSGFRSDIVDRRSNINYLVRENWWGPAAVCPPCNGEYQTCEGTLCLGPKNVVNEGTGLIDAGKPLAVSIKCPHGCSSHQDFFVTHQDSNLFDLDLLNGALGELHIPKFKEEFKIPQLPPR